MKTEFSLAQLADPDIAEADKILRACVHCGFCTATCPTYVLLGDELDSPRGRIYLIKEMLEKDRPPTRGGGQAHRPLPVVPRLHDHLSVRRELHASGRSGAGPDRAGLFAAADRSGLLRAVLAFVLPRPEAVPRQHDHGAARPAARGPAADAAGGAATPTCCGESRRCWRWRRAGCRRRDPPAAASFRPWRAARAGRAAAGLRPAGAGAAHQPGRHQSPDPPRHRGGAGQGRAMLRRADPSPRAGRRRAGARPRQRQRVAKEAEQGGLDAILVTASGCGTVIKDYGFMLREDREFAAPRRADIRAGKGYHRVSRRHRAHAIEPARRSHGRLSLSLFAAAWAENHAGLPKELLSKNGFVVKDVPESHLCCGSAGTYNILQPDIASRLRDRKIANIATVKPDMIAAGNIGCMVQIAGGTSVPVVHTIELLDWATGGPKPGLTGPG